MERRDVDARRCTSRIGAASRRSGLIPCYRIAKVLKPVGSVRAADWTSRFPRIVKGCSQAAGFILLVGYWAFWIAKELEALVTSRTSMNGIERAADIYAWMEQRHDRADHVLCVVSDDYLKAPYSTLERNSALWQAASKRPGFVLFVAVRACKLPTLSDHIRRSELYGVPEDAARIRFREFMACRLRPSRSTDQAARMSNLPAVASFSMRSSPGRLSLPWRR